MSSADNLKKIISSQKEVIVQLETECKQIENNDLYIENEKLKIELNDITVQNTADKKQLAKLSNENIQLKRSLYDQICCEKLSIIKMSQKKLNVYFQSSYSNELNRLTALEINSKARIQRMSDTLHKNNIAAEDDLYLKLNELTNFVHNKIHETKMQYQETLSPFCQSEQEKFDALKNEPISENVMRESMKKSNIESFVGLNIINKLGILLIIIGVVVASQYTYLHLSDYIKGIVIFGFGGIMLLVGELLNRKKPNVFSLGITAGGIAVLYVALVVSHFGLGILSAYPAIIVCVIITTVAFILSTRYNAQVILCFALVGAYLPMFSILGNPNLLYGAMLYFVILNLLALTIALKNKWIVSTFIGLGLNTLGTICIIFTGFELTGFMNQILTIAYVLFTFMIYTMIPILSSYKLKMKFTTSDNIMFAINTIFSSAIMYFTFIEFNLNDYLGVFTIIFATSYLCLGKFIEKKLDGEKISKDLFFLTGFVFVVLVIPFQFGMDMLSLGWLVQAVALMMYGILKNHKTIKKIGAIIGGLCILAFLIVDLITIGSIDFTIKYSAITLGSLFVLGSFIYKKELKNTATKICKYIAFINIWLFANYIVQAELSHTLEMSTSNRIYIWGALSIVVGMLIAYTLPRIKILYDNGIKNIACAIYVFELIRLFFFNALSTPFVSELENMQWIVGTTILVIISILSLLAIYDLLRLLMIEKKLGMQWFSILLTGYFLISLSQTLIVQYNLSFSSVIISIIYVIIAFLCILYGFAKRYVLLRRFGLCLSVGVTAKLFLIDLFSLTKGYRIISYFALGITLVAISFIYQYFNKKFDVIQEENEIETLTE